MSEMQQPEVNPFVRFTDMRDILAGLEAARATQITNRIEELVQTNMAAEFAVKLDGMAAHDKKDGGKDCGKDVKDGKETSDDKEASDLPDVFTTVYGDPTRIDINRLNFLAARQASRLRSLIAGGSSPVI